MFARIDQCRHSFHLLVPPVFAELCSHRGYKALSASNHAGLDLRSDGPLDYETAHPFGVSCKTTRNKPSLVSCLMPKGNAERFGEGISVPVFYDLFSSFRRV